MKIAGCLLWILLVCNGTLWSQESFFVARKLVTDDPQTHIITAAQEYVFLKDTTLNGLAFRQYAVLTFTDYADGAKEADTICIYAGPRQFQVLNSSYRAVVAIERAVTDELKPPGLKYDPFFFRQQSTASMIVVSGKEQYVWYDPALNTWVKWSDGTYLYEAVRDISHGAVRESVSKHRKSGPLYDLSGADSFVFNTYNVLSYWEDATRMSLKVHTTSGKAYTVKEYILSGQRKGRKPLNRKITYRVQDTFLRVNNQPYPLREFESNVIVKNGNTDSSGIVFSWLRPLYTNKADTVYAMDWALYTYGNSTILSVFPNIFYRLYIYPSYLVLQGIYNTRNPAEKFVNLSGDLPPRFHEETGIEQIYADNDSVYVVMNIAEPGEITVTITDGTKEHRFELGEVTATGRSTFALHCRIRPSETYPVSLSTRIVKDGRSYSNLATKTMFIEQKP